MVLLAEDHPINRRVLVHQLGVIGFHVDTAEDGAQALERFTSGRYGIVLTDLNMPTMDGFELARAIRRREVEAGLPRTPIVALSANVLPEEAEKCAAAGMDDFAGKPAAMPVIAEKLRRWMPDVEWPSALAPRPASPSGAALGTPLSDGVIDDAVLSELTGGDGELAAAILVDYVDSSGSDLAALREALDEASADEVRRHAHRINGASRTVGAHEAAELAASLESAAFTSVDDCQALRATIDELEVAVAKVASSLTGPTAVG